MLAAAFCVNVVTAFQAPSPSQHNKWPQSGLPCRVIGYVLACTTVLIWPI